MTGSSIWATLSINGIFFVTLVSLFEFYRNKVTDLYCPRARGNNPKYALPREGYFQWVIQLSEIGDEETFRIAGMDGYVFLRFIAFCSKVCTICGCIAALVLIPCYATSPSDEGMMGFELVSMANLEQRGTRLWASWVAAYAFTFVFLYLIHKEYEHFVVMRKKYFHGEVDIIPRQTRYTVQVENIPPELRSSAKLLQIFEALFPGQVMFAHVAISTPELDKLIAERDAVRDRLERTIAQFEGSDKNTRPLLDLKKFNPARYQVEKEVDSISFLTKRLQKLCSRTARLQRVITDLGEPPEGMPESPTTVLNPRADVHNYSSVGSCDSSGHQESLDSDSGDEDAELSAEAGVQLGTMYNPMQGALNLRKFSHIIEDVKTGISELFISTTGFVTFKTRKAQITAVRTSILLEQYPFMTAQQAPPPIDVIWANISASTRATEETAVFSAGAYYGCLAFWGGVMAFVAAVSTMSTLETYLPFVRSFDDFAYALVEGILPVVVVLTFSTLVSGAIAFIATNVEKRKTNSAVEMEVFKWYFMYQIANIYLILVAGSVWESVVRAIEHPAAIITYLSAALPSVSTFFINYIVTVTLSGVPYKLIRRFRALEYLFYRCTHFPQYTTRRMMKDGPFRHTRVQYGTELSDILYVLCIVLLYWVIAPVVLLFAMPLFWAWYYTWKYEFVFVVTRVYESGGELWYKIYDFCMFGLLAGTVAFMTYMAIKEGISQGPLLVPLPLIILVAWRHTETQFKYQSQTMPFDLAIRDDFRHTVESSGSAHNSAHGACASGSSSSAISSANPGNTAITGASNTGGNNGGSAEFSEDFMKQPNLVGPAEIFPYPYRVDGIPLFDAYGALNDVYVDDLPDIVDVTEALKGSTPAISSSGVLSANLPTEV